MSQYAKLKEMVSTLADVLEAMHIQEVVCDVDLKHWYTEARKLTHELPGTMDDDEIFQAYEISYVRENTSHDCEVIFNQDEVDRIKNGDHDPDFLCAFWSLYGWRDNHGEHIGDYENQEQARTILSRILGVPIPEFPGTTESFTLDGVTWR